MPRAFLSKKHYPFYLPNLMMKYIFLLLSLCFSAEIISQTIIKGTVKDAITGESLPGAAIIYGDGKGVTTDLDGKFQLDLGENGGKITVKFIGYKDYEQEIKARARLSNLEIELQPSELNEIEIIADIAIDRKTPVAFSDVSAIKIREELGTQDLPLILNSTPGVYATQSGGGDGDSRVNIRGFNQRNVAVMVDGIPMNDMENGQVYWSNWFGLDNVTQKVQVQRGLGASKLAIPAIGGSINILSQGIESKRNIVVSSEVGNNLNLRNSIGINSGVIGRGFGVTAAFSYRRNDGWVDQLGSRQMFYFLKLQKQWNRHSVSLSVMGSPQEHYQRLGRQRIQVFDTTYAKDLGATIDRTPGLILNQGLRYNGDWGYVTRDRGDDNAQEEVLNARKNYYHKPIFNLKHFWKINSNLALSNIVYASFGNGGGTRLNNIQRNAQGQLDGDFMYGRNTRVIPPALPFLPPTYPYNLTAVNDTSQYESDYYVQSSINRHSWYGLLSTLNYKINSNLDVTAGIDARYYQVENYQVVYDLLGGDYVYINDSQVLDANNPTRKVFREGDKINYHINSFVRQGGLFLLGEYEKNDWTAFVNVTGSINSYNRISYFALKDTTTNDWQQTGWQTFPGYTAKGGFKYRFNPRHSVYFNTGFLSRAQLMSNVFAGRTLSVNRNVENEMISSVEMGYVINNPDFRPAVNVYYTNWRNRPVTVPITDGTENYNAFVPGMQAIHYGIEFEAEYKVNKQITIDGVVSLGDWRWNSEATAYIFNEIGTAILDSLSFDTKGVRVGDAAQTQFSLGVRYEPVKGFYIKPRITYFDNNFADFSPEELQGDNGGRQSWKMPAYYMLDINMGYSYTFNKKYRAGIRLNLINVTDQMFITDATNGATFDASTAEVFMGQGFRWNVGLNFNF